MRALQIERLDGPEALELVDLPEPEGAAGVLIDVVAAGVAFPDLLLTRGRYQVRPDLPFTPGVEVAGTVRHAPEGSGLEPGQRVAAFPGLGGFAEVVAVNPGMVFALPDRLSFEAGAGLVLNYHTAHLALHRRGGLRQGETVLVHGAAGGVGSATLQLVRGAGARSIAVVSDSRKAEVVRQLGADEVVRLDDPSLPADEPSRPGWLAAVRVLTEGRGVDVVMDPVGGDRFDNSVRALGPEGRLLVVGFTEGRVAEIKVNRLLLRNASLVGVAWGALAAADPTASAEIVADLERLIEAGTVDPLVGAVYPLEAGTAALQELEERRAVGKVVLRVRESP